MYVKKGRPTVPRVTVPCTACGVPVTRYASDLATRKTGRTFCSKECRNRIGCKPKTGADANCEVCGKVFYRRRYSKQRFCSVACHNAGQTKPKVERNCATCGKRFELYRCQVAPKGRNTGRFCSRECMGIGSTKRYAGFDHNGRPAIVDFWGYVRVWEPNHPNAMHGRVREHRLVVEKALGRYLTTDEQVDHINRIKTDNRLENLQVLSASDHSIKTNGDRLREIQQAREVLAELEEYRKRFGPLA